MNEVWIFRKDQLTQAKGECEIMIAGAAEVSYVQAGVPRGGVQSRFRRADEDTVDSLLIEPFHQIKNLLRAAIKMASRFYMQYFHWAQNSSDNK